MTVSRWIRHRYPPIMRTSRPRLAPWRTHLKVRSLRDAMAASPWMTAIFPRRAECPMLVWMHQPAARPGWLTLGSEPDRRGGDGNTPVRWRQDAAYSDAFPHQNPGMPAFSANTRMAVRSPATSMRRLRGDRCWERLLLARGSFRSIGGRSSLLWCEFCFK